MIQDEALLALGASSLIGGALCALPERPPLICVSRNPPTSPQSRARWIRVDLTNPEWGAGFADLRLRKALALAPIWTVAPVIDQLADLGVERLVSFSSTSRFTKAASPDPAEREVADRLARSETRLIESCERRGVAWTLLRPTLIYLWSSASGWGRVRSQAAGTCRGSGDRRADRPGYASSGGTRL